MKTHPNVLAAVDKIIMDGHNAQVNAVHTPLLYLIVSSTTGLVAFCLFQLINVIF